MGQPQVKIGLLGTMRSGKDTVAMLFEDLLVRNTDQKAVKLAFSDEIHVLINSYMPELYMTGKPREALQQIGQLFRKFNPDVWVESLLEGTKYDVAKYRGDHLIVTDVRQPNEAKMLKEEGFTLIKVTATEQVRLERIKANADNFTPEMLHHETEQIVQTLPYDYVIDNSTTYSHLVSQVSDILEEVLNEYNQV